MLLTGRHAGRVADAAAEVSAALPPGAATVEGRVLDVRDAAAIHTLADELGSVDVVFSNAYERMNPGVDPATEVDAVADTSNVATSQVLRAFGPRLRAGGRLIVVASAQGTLDKLDPRVRPRFAAAAEADLDAVDRLVEEWRTAVLAGRAETRDSGPGSTSRRRWPRWPPSAPTPGTGGKATSATASSWPRCARGWSTPTRRDPGSRT